MKSNLHKSFLAALLLITACRPEIKTPAPSAGSADFSTYIAVGDSQTAGYADGGLYRESQLNSFPAIIAAQLKAVGGGNFSQPLFSEAQASGSGYLQLTALTNGVPTTTTVAPTAIRGVQAVPNYGNVTLYTKYTGDNNNYGIPALKVQQITFTPYGNLNGYYERLLPNNSPNNSTAYLDFVTAKPYTFFTCWLGNNDALLYAVAGGADPNNQLTDKVQFAQLYTALINKLTVGGQKGVVATIPDVSAIPYFNTVTTGAILANVQKANAAVQAIYINAKANADVSNTSYAPRAATAEDLVVLTFPTTRIGQPVTNAAGTFPYGLDPRAPIDNQYVLDKNEAAQVRDYVTAYNNTIKSVAAAKGLGVFDAYSYLNLAIKGETINGVNVSTAYITGGLFSLDGVHLTPRGYAIEANEFIKAANAQYGSSIPTVNVSNYNGVKFP